MYGESGRPTTSNTVRANIMHLESTTGTRYTIWLFDIAMENHHF